MKAALSETGFRDVNVVNVPLTNRLPSASAFLNAIMRGMVRTKALFLAQDKAALTAIAAAVADGMDRLFRGAEGFDVPMPAMIGSGVKR